MTRCLADEVKPKEVERVKCLPQDHVERVCNELAVTGAEGFEQELKAVIFSHVPDAEKLGNATLDDLVRFRTGEKQKRIDSLIKQLRELNRSRAVLEARADPNTKHELLERIKRRESELDAHDNAKPPEVTDPATTGGQGLDDQILNRLLAAEASKEALSDQISIAHEHLLVQERHNAVAARLLEKLDNFKKDVDVFLPSLRIDATELGLDPGDLVAVTINRSPVENAQNNVRTTIADLKQQLDAIEPPGLRKQLAAAEVEIEGLQSKLV